MHIKEMSHALGKMIAVAYAVLAVTASALLVAGHVSAAVCVFQAFVCLTVPLLATHLVAVEAASRDEDNSPLLAKQTLPAQGQIPDPILSPCALLERSGYDVSRVSTSSVTTEGDQ